MRAAGQRAARSADLGLLDGIAPCRATLLPRPLQAFEKAPPDVQEILSKPIKELGLKLEGSPLERSIQRLYRELDR